MTASKRFSAAPASWFHFGSLTRLRRGPVSDVIAGRKIVGFLDSAGHPTVLDARCSHMGSDLSNGCVKNGRIACPLHGWEYRRDGRCERIPGGDVIPDFARQSAYPTAVLGGHVFFFNGTSPRFPLPFFDGENPDDLFTTQPFELHDTAPWYLVGGNGFDRQHFNLTHDRRILCEPELDTPTEFSCRIKLHLAIEGQSWTDRVTRAFAGDESRMTVVSWCGSLFCATAEFRRAKTRGMVSIQQLSGGKMRMRVILWLRRSRTAVGRAIFDPVHAAFRRKFIRAFFEDDLGKLTGISYDRARMIPSDNTLVEYLDWLQKAHR